jgi:hypothetical protein
MRPRWVASIILIATVGLLASWGIVRAVEDRRCRAKLADALREMDEG